MASEHNEKAKSTSGSSSKATLLSFCKNILSDIGIQKEQSQDNNQKEIILRVYHEKCSSLITEISSLNSEALSFVVMTNILQKIAQLVLDFTYVEECCLVDQDFLLQAAYERVTYIIENLSSVESLSKKLAPDNPCPDVLSPSIAECIHWRNGALLYMYCHTLNSRCSREELPPHFLQCLQNGSQHLVSMLSTRSSPQCLHSALDAASGQDLAESASSGDHGDMLMSQGIYSDTHLLALMYLGEMCYWYAQLTQLSPDTDTPAGSSKTHSGEGQSDAMQGDSTKTGGDKSVSSAGLSHSADAESERVISSSSSTSQRQASSESSVSLQQGQSLDMLRMGQLCLENYVTAAKGPMSAGGWNTNRAEEILQYFANLSI